MPMPAIPSTDLASADLVEIFSSLQGEGELVGFRQVFLRFCGCNLSCHYCDTNFLKGSICRIEIDPGSGDRVEYPNPVAVEQVTSLLGNWKKQFPGAHHSITITGGEPLLHVDLLQQWLPQLRTLLPVSLETNGTLPQALHQIIDQIDRVAMDIKLASLTGQPTDWDAHRAFLEIAGQVDCSVKMVVGESVSDDEIIRATELVAGVGGYIPIILQPVTKGARVAISTRRLLHLQSLIASIHTNVRVIPQTHVFMGVM